MWTWTAISPSILLPGLQIVAAQYRIAFQVDEPVVLYDCLPHTAFITHSDFAQHLAGCIISAEVSREDPVEIEVVESVTNDGPCSFRRIAVSPEAHADPVSQLRAFVL